MDAGEAMRGLASWSTATPTASIFTPTPRRGHIPAVEALASCLKQSRLNPPSRPDSDSQLPLCGKGSIPEWPISLESLQSEESVRLPSSLFSSTASTCLAQAISPVGSTSALSTDNLPVTKGKVMNTPVRRCCDSRKSPSLAKTFDCLPQYPACPVPSTTVQEQSERTLSNSEEAPSMRPARTVDMLSVFQKEISAIYLRAPQVPRQTKEVRRRHRQLRPRPPEETVTPEVPSKAPAETPAAAGREPAGSSAAESEVVWDNGLATKLSPDIQKCLERCYPGWRKSRRLALPPPRPEAGRAALWA